MKLSRLTIIVTIIFPGIVYAQKSSYNPPLPSLDYPYPQSGVKIGQGWDSFNLRATEASCVDVEETRLEKASFETHVEQVRSSYSLITKTTASISAAYGGFGAKASASLAGTSSASINTDDQNFLFTFNSSNGSTFATAPEKHTGQNSELSDQTIKAITALKSDSAQQDYIGHIWAQPSIAHSGAINLTPAARELRTKDKPSFDRICGDGFVSAIHRGARITLLLTQRLSSSADAGNLVASLSASGYGLSANADYSTSTQKLTNTAGLSFRVFQEGGIPLKPPALKPVAEGAFNVNDILPSPDQLIASPIAFAVTITPYENLIPGLTGKDQFPSPTRLLTISDYYLALLDEYRLVDNILLAARSNTDDESFPFDRRIIKIFGGEAALEQLSDEIHVDLAFLETAIGKCYAEESRLCTIPDAANGAKNDFLAKSKQLTTMNDDLKTKAEPTLPLYQSSVTTIAKKIQAVTDQITADGIKPSFFLNFYQYVARTPLPKSAYRDFAALRDLKFLTAVPGDKENEMKAANDALRRTTLVFRLTPWKRFFCETLKSPMCISESDLRVIAASAVPSVNAEDLIPVAPPPPPPPPRPDPAPPRYEPFPCHSPAGGNSCL